MPFFIPVDLNTAYAVNQKGQLAEDQIRAVTHAIKARKVTALILILCNLPLALILGGVVITGNWQTQFSLQMILLVVVLASLGGLLFGFAIWRGANALLPKISTLSVTKVVGEAQKFNHGIAYEIPGVGGSTMHTLPLQSGNVQINTVMYGVLPGKLYGEIVDGKRADFYVVETPTPGFKRGMVVNCSN